MGVLFAYAMGVAAVLLAAVAGAWFVRGLMEMLSAPAGRVRMRVRGLAQETDSNVEGLGSAKVLVQAAAMTADGWQLAVAKPLSSVATALDRGGSMQDVQRLGQAGMSMLIEPQDMARVRAWFGVISGLTLGVLALGDIGMMVVLALVGFALGARIPSFLLARAADDRVRQCIRDLPEMIDMIALASKAGMSFDAALQSYADRFDTPLAYEFGRAAETWKVGAVTRDDAIEGIARLMDVDPLTRFAAAVQQAMKLGAPLATILEEQALDARKAQKMNLEEQIAKAPIKMFLPLGTLILPAMLILLLGPVILQVASGMGGTGM